MVVYIKTNKKILTDVLKFIYIIIYINFRLWGPMDRFIRSSNVLKKMKDVNDKSDSLQYQNGNNATRILALVGPMKKCQHDIVY